MTTLATLPSTAAAMATLVSDHQILAIALADIPALEDPAKTQSICSDGKEIWVNPDFLSVRTDEGRVYMLAFMSLMQTNMCLERRGERDHVTWSLACNKVAHLQLEEMGVTGRPPEVDPLVDHDMKGKTSEEVYEILTKDRESAIEMRIDSLMSDLPLGKMLRRGNSQIDDLMAEAVKRYSPDELSAAFDLVKDATHWKNPIDTVIDRSSWEIVSHAIPYYIGSVAQQQDIEGQPDRIRVTASGYQNALLN